MVVEQQQDSNHLKTGGAGDNVPTKLEHCTSQVAETQQCNPSRVDDPGRVKLTDVNPHLVCVLCHGYFVDATTITECLHSFCRSCIFRHLETKPFCPICEVQVHTRLHRSLKSDKTLQDIVYKLVPGLFHSEMERRRQFYKMYPHRDEHLEPERRGVGLDRLIYSPSDTISLSLEFYDNEREKEEWSAVTCPANRREAAESELPPPQSTSGNNNNNNKRYLQCPAVFKMAHLKKFIRQKYNLPANSDVEIIYKRESLPDSYSLMDVAYIYTWKRNGPMRFYYRLPGIIDIVQYEKIRKEQQEREVNDNSRTSEGAKIVVEAPEKADKKQEKSIPTTEKITKDLPKTPDTTPVLQPIPKENLPPVQEKVEKIILSLKKSPRKDNGDKPVYHATLKLESTVASKPVAQPTAPTNPSSVPNKSLPGDNNATSVPPKNQKSAQEQLKINSAQPKETVKKEVEELKDSNGVKLSKQDELPVSVLLSLGQCRVGSRQDNPPLPSQKQIVTNPTPRAVESKIRIGSKVSVNKIANDLQQKAAINGVNQTKHKENPPTGQVTNNTIRTTVTSTQQPLLHQEQIKVDKVSNDPAQNVFAFPSGPPVVNGKAAKIKKNHSQPKTNHQPNNDMGVIDQRIQQLYKPQGGNNVKPESRLAHWLNNRFQAKPQQNGTIQNQSNSLAQAISNRVQSQQAVVKTAFKNIAPKVNPSPQSQQFKVPKSGPQILPRPNGLTPLKVKSSKSSKNQTSLVQNKNGQIIGCHIPSPPTSSENGIISPGNATPRPTVNYFVPNFAATLPSMPIISSPVHVPSYTPVKSSIVYAPIITPPRPVDHPTLNGFSITAPAITTSIEPDTASNTVKSKQEPLPESEVKSSSPTLKDSSKNIETSTETLPTVPSKQPTPTITPDKPSSTPVSNLDQEVSILKRKLEELKKSNELKGREVPSCQITKENPDSEEAKRRRDTTPVVSIELMRGSKRPVPALKAIQEVVDLGKRKSEDMKSISGDKKLKLSAKRDGKVENSNALDLSRCGAPNKTPPHWFNPIINHYLPSNK